jgi:oligopeptide/dipeptide ABC transporter ATP-binding protein
VKAVNSLSLEIYEGETLGLVGESGSGKTVTALSIMGLVPSPPGRIESDRIMYRETLLTGLPEARLRKIRGKEIAMVFQEPLLSLNPVFTAGGQIVEAIAAHRPVSELEARQDMLELLRLVGIRKPAEVASRYPHQLSGGMRQRVMIAMAICAYPSILIADEPTTALDVTIASRILRLLRELQSKFKMSILLITHDFGVIAETADRVAVMYAGEIVEYAPVKNVFKEPAHPYTRGLLDCVSGIQKKEGPLHTIPGYVPDLRNLPAGCNFADRCPYAVSVCRREKPRLAEIKPDVRVACHHPRIKD